MLTRRSFIKLCTIAGAILLSPLTWKNKIKWVDTENIWGYPVTASQGGEFVIVPADYGFTLYSPRSVKAKQGHETMESAKKEAEDAQCRLT